MMGYEWEEEYFISVKLYFSCWDYNSNKEFGISTSGLLLKIFVGAALSKPIPLLSAREYINTLSKQLYNVTNTVPSQTSHFYNVSNTLAQQLYKVSNILAQPLYNVSNILAQPLYNVSITIA